MASGWLIFFTRYHGYFKSLCTSGINYGRQFTVLYVYLRDYHIQEHDYIHFRFIQYGPPPVNTLFLGISSSLVFLMAKLTVYRIHLYMCTNMHVHVSHRCKMHILRLRVRPQTGELALLRPILARWARWDVDVGTMAT